MRPLKPALLALLAVVGAAAAIPSAAFGQCPETRASRPLFVTGIANEVPLRAAGSVGILLPVWDLEYGDPGCTVPAYRGVVLEASAGRGGQLFAVGLARWVKPDDAPALFGQDVLVSVIRTRTSPRAADANSTYVGVEGGVTVLAVRVSAGVARRLTSEGSNSTIFRWSLGARVAW